MPRRPSAPAAAARAFVDSSGFIALLSARDDRHAEADRLFRAAVAGRTRLFTSNLIVAETHRLLLHRAGPRAACAALDRTLASPSLELVFVERAHHDAARAWLARLADQKITYTDAVSFALMTAMRLAAAITFDRDFELAGFALLRID